MSDLPFEALFRERCRAQGIEWNTLRYARTAAGGLAQAHRFVPQGPPRGRVLVVHGAGNDALFALTRLFSALLERRFEIFSFDVDGHGRGSTTRLTCAAGPSCIAAAIDQWGDPPPGLPLHAVGISLGGSLLLHWIAGARVPIASATLMCAPLKVELTWRAIGRELALPVLRTLWRERAHFGLTGLIPSFGPFRRDLYPLRLGERAGPGMFGYVEVINRLLGELDLPGAARRTSSPVLLVYGGRDLLVPSSQAQRLHQLLPVSELLLLQEDTHLSTPLSPAAQARLLEWIERHHPAKRSTA